MRRIENSFIPEKSAIDTAIWLGLCRVFTGDADKFLCDEMLRVPELNRALVGNSGKDAGDG
jgi:hypothetical protein